MTKNNNKDKKKAFTWGKRSFACISFSLSQNSHRTRQTNAGDKGCAEACAQGEERLGGETSASEQKGVMQWTGTLLRNVACFACCRLRSGFCGVVCPLDTAIVTELWRLDLFSCTSSSFLCAGTLSPRGKCCYFLREV